MTEQEQRVAIANACGWKEIVNADGDLSEPHLTRTWTEWIGPNGQQDSEPPDYLNDLNAMHEAEKSLLHEKLLDHFRILEVVVDRDNDGKVTAFAVGRATAAQRAEAFLRTIGKWKE